METAVYFDLDGTLLDYTAPFSELVSRTVPVPVTDEMVDMYSEQVLEGLANLHDAPYERAFEALCETYGLDLDPASLATAFVDTEVSSTTVPPAARTLVEAVASQHHTGVLTNGDGRMQRRKLAEHGLDSLVDAVVVSNEFGARKPDRAIFEGARERFPADTVVYVGDTYEEDIVPARDAGFLTVYVGEEDRSAAAVSADGIEELAALLVPLLGADSSP